MNERDLKEFHHRLCLLMNEVHKICIDNNIKYTMMGGTLIGALRHKGFIPWDDDIDIGMTYDNYKRFVEVAFSLNHEWVEFDLAGVTDDFFFPFIKAYDNRTTYLEGYRDTPKGIFIDIFPVVYAGNSKVSAYLSFKRHRFFHALLKRKAYHLDTGETREKFLALLAKQFSVNSIMTIINKNYEHLNKKKKTYSSDMDGNTHGIVPSFLFDDYQFYDFDGFKYMGMKNADKYLRLVFGNYMELPPEEKRVPPHIDFMDLHLPYREFLRQKNKKLTSYDR